MSTPAANRAYEDRFIAKHGVSRGAYRWHNGNEGEREQRRHEVVEAWGAEEAEVRTPFGTRLTTAADEAASRAGFRYRMAHMARRAQHRLDALDREIYDELCEDRKLPPFEEWRQRRYEAARRSISPELEAYGNAVARLATSMVWGS